MRQIWTEKEKQYLRKAYPRTDTAEIAKKLGRPVRKIYSMVSKLGLKKDPDVMAAILKHCGAQLLEKGKSYRYPKGHVPENKGLRRPGWAPGRMAETQFKKGERRGVAVKLYQPIGTERLSKDGYLERKVNDDMPLQARWKAVHRIIWEEHNSPIPKGMKIAFKDGNKLNRDIANLELVTAADMMSRNTLHNYPEPVKGQIHALAGFKRKLNSYAKKQDRRSPQPAVRHDGTAAG